MRAFHRHPPLRPRLSWLIWLALLWPLAQTAAAWHTLSHLAQAAASHDDPQQAHAANCELCLTAAAVSGGALPGAAATAPLPAARREPPPAASASVWPAWPPQAYRSRAPPQLLL